MLDLNTVIAPGSGFQLTNAFNINDRGEILAKGAPLGFTPNDDADLGHLVLLIPCGEGDECPEDDTADTSTAVTKPETTDIGDAIRQAPRQELRTHPRIPASSGNDSKPVGRSPVSAVDDGTVDYIKDHLDGFALSGVGRARRCTPRGMQCPPQFPPCCPGLKCRYGGLRSFCEP
jgi:hypothetical protein